MTGAGGLAFCAAITANHLAFGRVLARSLHAVHPGVPLFAVVAERSVSLAGWHEPDMHLVPIEALGVEDLTHQAFICSAHELTVVAKPLILRHVLAQGFHQAVFLDADVLVTGDLAPLLAATRSHAMTVSPHLLGPLGSADRAARELAIVRAGTFNGGFVGVSARPEAHRFLDWWQARLRTHNRLEPWAGLHHDQRWLDFLPSFFDEVGIVRDPGVNVAYWNLPERGLHRDARGWRVGDGPCRFFHFSGFDPSEPSRLSRHARSLALGDAEPAVEALTQDYMARLRAAGLDDTRDRPYSFGEFDDGIPVPAVARGLWRALAPEVAAPFGDPFATGRGTFVAWLQDADPEPGPGRGLSRLWRAIYRQRGDLQQAFADPAGADRERWQDWVRTFGIHEHRVDVRLTR